MKLAFKTDYEQLLFEKLHVKSLKKIIEIKNQQIEIFANELKLVNENEFVDTVVIINKKDGRRLQRIKQLENRLKYFTKRYNRMISLITIETI